jgi:hypothetical protein
MREGSSSKVQYKVQSGGRQINTSYDDLKANRRYYNKQTRTYKNQAKENVFTTLVFITLFVFFAFSSSIIQPPANSSFVDTPDEATEYISSISSDAGNIALGSINVVVNIVRPIAETIQTVVQLFGTLVSQLIALIEWFYDPVANYNITDIEDPTIICTTYDDLSSIEQINLQSRRFFHNLLNEPDLNIEEYYIYTLQQRYGTEEYNQVCTS